MTSHSETSEVLLVSIFGRGNWLAAELASRGFKVCLVDMSAAMGRWAPEDWEGPFGLFKADWLTASQVSRLSEEDYLDEIPEGFTVWPKDGPIDMRGQMAQEWLERIPGYAEAKTFSQQQRTLPNHAREDAIDELMELGFKRNWLAQFANQFASTTFAQNALSLNFGEPLPLWSPFLIRRITRRGLQKSLSWCEDKGVEIVSSPNLVDVSLDGNRMIAIQVGGEQSRVYKAENFVWCLTSAESHFVSEKISALMFPDGALQPDWSWMRWRIGGNLGTYKDVIPSHFALIEDLGLPWTHSNLLVVQRCAGAETFDVWARLPSHHRFQRAYCEDFGLEIVKLIDRRIPEFKGQVQDQPQDYHYDAVQLGPSLFPVYDPSKRSDWRPEKIKNIHFDGPEWTTNLDWTGRFSRQNQILQALETWKKQKLEKLSKGGRHDRTVHAP